EYAGSEFAPWQTTADHPPSAPTPQRSIAMSIFSTLLSKLGMGAKAAPARAPASAPASTRPAASGTATASQPATQPAPAPAPPPVDIEAVLEQRAAASNQKLNWRT